MLRTLHRVLRRTASSSIVSLAPQCRGNPASGTSNVVPLRPLKRCLDSPAFFGLVIQLIGAIQSGTDISVASQESFVCPLRFPCMRPPSVWMHYSKTQVSIRAKDCHWHGPSGDSASYSFQGRNSGLSLMCLVRALCIHYSTHRVLECLNSSLSAWKTAEGERCIQTGNISLDYGYDFHGLSGQRLTWPTGSHGTSS